MAHVVERHEALAAAFDAFRRDPAFGGAELGRSREEALDRFFERGFPTTRDEEWRFTNISPIAQLSFVRASGAAQVPRSSVEPFLLPGLRPVVVINGMGDGSVFHRLGRSIDLAGLWKTDPSPYLTRLSAANR